jgi:hypothetical protein
MDLIIDDASWVRYLQLKQKIEDFANADVLTKAEDDFFKRTQEYMDNLWTKEAI